MTYSHFSNSLHSQIQVARRQIFFHVHDPLPELAPAFLRPSTPSFSKPHLFSPTLASDLRKQVWIETEDGHANTSWRSEFLLVDTQRGIVRKIRRATSPGPLSVVMVLQDGQRVEVRPIYCEPVYDFGFLQYDPKSVQNVDLVALDLVALDLVSVLPEGGTADGQPKEGDILIEINGDPVADLTFDENIDKVITFVQRSGRRLELKIAVRNLHETTHSSLLVIDGATFHDA
ncbi:uncharacterized protein FFNC_15348 [Fusarium fujikuroi]|nr:uncharacterized protein FFNC_15348 [Fusarium fujikuroi]